MRIGILLISNNFSGAERVVYELLNEFSKKHTVFLFVNREIEKNYSHLKKIKIINVGPFFSKSKIFWPKIIWRIRKKIIEEVKKNRIQVLNPHLEYSFLTTPKMKIYKIVGVLHGGELINNNNFLAKRIITNFLDRADRLISVSHYLNNLLYKEHKNKSVIISNGVNSKKFKKMRRIDKNIVLYTGRFIERKGFLELVNAAKQLPQYEFWFAGQGPLANLINLPNTKNLGFKTTKELVKLYNQATICVFPSHWEALPLCGLEAMSCQRAVIATPIGFNEYIENEKDGIIIPAKDEKALKESIIKLMTDEKLRKRLEKNARKKALQYSWDKIAKQYLEVFR